MTRFLFPMLLILVLLAGCTIPTQPVVPTDSGTDTPQSPAIITPFNTTAPAVPTIEPSATAQPEQPAASWIAYTGSDGNIWLVDPVNGAVKPVTQDAVPMQGGNEAISYCCTQWSWDGQLLAFERRLDQPVDTGYQYRFSLVVYNVATGEMRTVLDNQQTAGFSWKPVTHLISYGLPVDPNYFASRGVVDASKANGIWAVNVDNGEVSELVKPERGLSLVNPRWSPSGQFVSFDEVSLMEGRGKFAYYNLEEPTYIAWDKPIGSYDWSPDNQLLVYDFMTYAPSGEEQIMWNHREGTTEQQVSPSKAGWIAFNPVYSPQGDQVAYFQQEDMDSEKTHLAVQKLSGGEPYSLGIFASGAFLSWSPDGSSLLLARGSYDARQIVLVSLADGTTRVIASGNQPAWQITTR